MLILFFVNLAPYPRMALCLHIETKRYIATVVQERDVANKNNARLNSPSDKLDDVLNFIIATKIVIENLSIYSCNKI